MLNEASNDEIWENSESEKPDYLRLFEERIERLAPLPERRTVEIAEKFGLDKIGLYPVKFVASVLYAPPRNGDLEILLPNVTEYERYSQGGHDRILEDFSKSWSDSTTFATFVLCTSNGQKYLLGQNLWPVKRFIENGDERAQQCFERYKINAGFRIDLHKPLRQDPLDDLYTLDLGEESNIFKGNFTELVDELIKDDLFLQVAKTYELTNTEYLRLSLIGELPEDKTHPISTIT